MALPAQSAPQSLRPATGTQVRKLKKGEMLFSEGDTSRAMYFLKSGMIRLYKKKGDSVIELDTIHSGSVLGELAFLDGNPRSASGEALTDCDLIEISGPAFQDVITKMPDWLKMLLKTVVGRLRTASTRIRQLESASTAFDYSDKSGKRSQHYIYLSPTDVLKIATALLLVASRNPVNGIDGIEIRVGLLQRYANQVMGIPVAKITTFLDILSQTGNANVGDQSNSAKVVLKDPNFLEQLIAYLNEENLLEPSKRHDVTLRGFIVMSLIAKHIKKFKKDETTGLVTVNIAGIRAQEASQTGKEPFRMEEFPELVKLGYATNVTIKTADEVLTIIKEDTFMHAYRLQKIVMAINAVNEQKRRTGSK